MMHLLQGGSIVKTENVNAFVKFMEEVEDDLETMRTMLIALQASKSPPVQKTFVDSAGLWNIQRWMKHARKDPTNPLCLQVLEKVILVLRELPLTIKHLQGSSLGITVSKLAADTNVSLNIRSKATLLKEQWMEMIENNSSKVPRLETEDSQSDNPRKKTRMDDASRLSQEQVLPKFMKYKPGAIHVPPVTITSHPLPPPPPPPMTTTTTTKSKAKIQENANFFKELARALPRATPQSPSFNSRAAMTPRSSVSEHFSSPSSAHQQRNPRSPVVDRFSSSTVDSHQQSQASRPPDVEHLPSSSVEVQQQNRIPQSPVLEHISSSSTVEAHHRNHQYPRPPVVERLSSSSTTDSHQQTQPNHLNDAKNQSFLRGDYQDTYMDEDSNQFEAAKVHLQKAILKRKDPHQKTKKSVRFKAGDDLVQVKEFEKDPAYHEDECDDKRHEDEDERERRARDERYDDRHGSGYNDQLSADFERWSLRQYNPNKSEFVMSNSVTRGLVAGNYWRSPMVLTGLPELKKTGQESHEIGIQGYREATVPPVEYHLMDHIPPSPAEPDAETTPLGPPTRKIALWTSPAAHASILLSSLQAISGFLSRSQLSHEPVARFMSPLPIHPSQH
ncbi:hypothetical protein MVEG_10227 [Podila verticillata NRRL 6337]|nr:hypothetical protein MVEG_10227 [Podila verticillata NRRL 6337]